MRKGEPFMQIKGPRCGDSEAGELEENRISDFKEPYQGL